MNSPDMSTDLPGRRILIPGGTGAVGEGIVRQYLNAGADVVVPSRSSARAEEFRLQLGQSASDRLHLVVHDYTTFAGAEDLAEQMERRLGGIDDVVAPIGGWWAGKSLWEINETDWRDAFVGLASAHMAVLRAVLPRMEQDGAYSVVLGQSASFPVPGSGLVSMEQAAVLMMQQVLEAELQGRQRVFALVLGPVNTRLVTHADPSWVSAAQVGAVAVAASTATGMSGRRLSLANRAEADEVLAMLRAG
jgi:NAD(P)-dependent dehydrogenase (short-subunit alcohol dehydrogenase family)